MRKLTQITLLTMALFTTNAWADDGTIDFLPDGVTTTNIASPGSYQLSGNVTMSTNVTAISITASDVTIDLGGHTITGTGAGSGDGINLGASVSNVHVLNGALRNFGDQGIDLQSFDQSDVLIEGLMIESCGSGGIRMNQVTSRVHIRDCTLSGNSFAGLHLGLGVGNRIDFIIENSRFIGNSGDGIFIPSFAIRGIVRGNVCSNNSSDGIENASITSVIVDNICISNTGNGISDLSISAFIANNYAARNGTEYFNVNSVTSQAASNEFGDNLMP